MNKALAWMASMVVATSAMAQTGGLPPEQAPAGAPDKFRKPTAPKAVDAPPKAAAVKPTTKAERSAARKEVRAEKVGGKPID